ncbi:M23 family metallopeptidase [Streptosporangium sandarakinum]|uniref:Murein DD-endopeptidase MepM/ murein hydrolase activator NlpD n=1 Tax=Streptosporangium sandarakinum TaxID=1260955 RepID=A0A852V833_9ACTN|nr:M23 family metallopeptidase [Streptosporangium sandarakinum]NYF44250.1 murein DD-endopeptidase MepM/ murein hydrolase activator NlpD [Streptosporangium sandarakinum]
MRLTGVLTTGFALLVGLAGATAAAPGAVAATGLTAVTATAAVTDYDPELEGADPPNDPSVELPPTTLATPSFQMPFPCGQSWTGNSSASSAHQSWEIDFNRGGTADADKGDTVVAAAAGTVVISAHQGSTNGYGNLVKIDHGGGWSSYYAHLDTRSVSAGATVSQGQKIGTVGNTSKPGNNISPHLHYEVRLGTSYPSNIQKAVFNGTTFGYPAQTLTSKNGCGSGGTNPYTAQEVCGSGYSVIDSAALGTAGTVYLLYNSSNGYNCVATLKKTSLGTDTATTAYLEVQGKTRVTDSGSYGYYAGPVRAAAAGQCVKWGGKAGSSTYDSPFEHCG